MRSVLNNRVLQHVAFWCFYVFLYAFNYHKDRDVSVDIMVAVFTLPSHLFFTYCQLYLLIPRFLLKKKFGFYLLLTVVFIKAAIMINWFSYSLFSEPLQLTYMMYMKDFSFWESLRWSFDIKTVRTLFALLMICGIAVSIKLLKEWYAENDNRKKVEKEKVTMELEMLKAQVHPHFLFNTLNNLYSLTLTHSDKAPVVVAHLADILRYMLYECNEKGVTLEKEVDILKEYVELEKLRYGNRIDVAFVCNGNIGELTIAPLLLLPFLENCFKHGTSEELGQCWINIYLHAENNKLTFIMSNSFSEGRRSSIAGGLGLQNIRKRLELIYPEKYELSINAANEIYTTKLTIELAKIEPSPAINKPEPLIILQPA